MKFFLVRHAEFQSTARGYEEYEANAKAPLSSYGLIEASVLAKKLQRLGIDKIFYSPFQRTRQTAEIVHRQTGIPSVCMDELREHKIVSPEKTRAAWRKLRQAMEQDHALTAPDSESFNQAGQRLQEVISRLEGSLLNKVCLITHERLIQAWLSLIYPVKPLTRIDTASITLIELTQHGPILRSLNDRPLSFSLFCTRLKRRIYQSCRQKISVIK
ncbi:histidine phosphatase family protein [Candidatus Uhrbacteria bacterium]|nr:histidine phosphatase family protein [Candidatus Uhrbacteria bacterium]